MRLFQPDAPWPEVAAHTSVFKVYLGFVRDSTDADLRLMITSLQARHIALALEMPVLVETGWCKPGVAHQPWMIGPVQRLRDLGADLRYVAMVGPLVDGHISTAPFACQRPIADVAADAARTVAALRRIFPSLIVGEIEPVNDGPGFPTPDELEAWLDAFAAASGQPVAFLHADTLWGGRWRPRLSAIAALLHDRHIPFGIIFGGGTGELSGAGYAQDSLLHADQAESLLGRAPEQVIFQSWGDYPHWALPETDPTTQTGIVRDYLRPASHLSLTGRTVRLSGPDEAPIAQASLIAETHDPRPAATLQPQTIEGEVPHDAVTALFALRAHTECAVADGPADVLLTGFTFTQRDTEQAPFIWDLRSWGTAWAGVVSLQSMGGSPIIHVDATPSKHLVLNGPHFPVVADRPFSARFVWQVEPAAADAGCAAVIFFDRTGVERHRIGFPFTTSWRPLAAVRTRPDGTAELPQVPERLAARIRYDGDTGHRPAELFASRWPSH